MPKFRRHCSHSYEPSKNTKLTPTAVLETEEDPKEWEDARCPVCMEHPHNAVLLICSSYNKGCRPYMCDTSYRHSNCLDQFRKSSSRNPSSEEDTQNHAPVTEESTVEIGSQEDNSFSGMHKLNQKLVCPLCRGEIRGWIIMDSARRFMNAKLRICASESCEFTGNYTDLRKHARVEHPRARPSEADPERERNWRRLERQRDIGDVLSTIQSSFGEDDGLLSPMDNSSWLTVFLFIRYVGSERSSSRSHSRSGGSRGHTRRRFRLVGGGLEGSGFMSEESESSDGGSSTWMRRVRRRLSSPDDEN